MRITKRQLETIVRRATKKLNETYVHGAPIDIEWLPTPERRGTYTGTSFRNVRKGIITGDVDETEMGYNAVVQALAAKGIKLGSTSMRGLEKTTRLDWDDRRGEWVVTQIDTYTGG